MGVQSSFAVEPLVGTLLQSCDMGIRLFFGDQQDPNSCFLQDLFLSIASILISVQLQQGYQNHHR
jgi:hypothetical protein